MGELTDCPSCHKKSLTRYKAEISGGGVSEGEECSNCEYCFMYMGPKG